MTEKCWRVAGQLDNGDASGQSYACPGQFSSGERLQLDIRISPWHGAHRRARVSHWAGERKCLFEIAQMYRIMKHALQW